MNKGLRALKRIEDFLKVNTPHWKQDVGYIEKELKRLEKYDKLNRSLGCEVDNVIAALRKCIYVKEDDGTINWYCDLKLSYTCDCEGEWLSNYQDIFIAPGLKGCVFLRDYGKTWALTKEELL